MSSFARGLRRNPRLAWIGYLFLRVITPVIVILLLVIAILVAVFGRWVWHERHRAEVDPPGELAEADRIELAVGESKILDFRTSQPYAGTSIWLEPDKWYRIECEPTHWRDDELLASPEGLSTSVDEGGPGLALHWLQQWLKRVPDQPVFKFMAAVGKQAAVVIPIGAENCFTPPKCGRLYLFVNDVPGYYSNNRGIAKVHVTRIE